MIARKARQLQDAQFQQTLNEGARQANQTATTKASTGPKVTAAEQQAADYGAAASQLLAHVGIKDHFVDSAVWNDQRQKLMKLGYDVTGFDKQYAYLMNPNDKNYQTSY